MLKWFQKINLLACANIFNYLENWIACLEISAVNQAAHAAPESNVTESTVYITGFYNV